MRTLTHPYFADTTVQVDDEDAEAWIASGWLPEEPTPTPTPRSQAKADEHDSEE